MATTQAASDLLGGLSSTFLKWITDDLMPVLYASVVITLMVIGIILHSLILHGMRKNNRFRDPFHKIIIHLTVMDLINILLLMTVAVIHCFVDDWLLGDEGCTAFAVIFNVIFSMTFSYSVWSGLERLLCITNQGLWQKIFLNGCYFSVFVSLNWVLIVGLCCLPISQIGISSIVYYAGGYQCDFDHSASVVFVNAYFAMVYFLPFLLYIVFTAITIHIRRHQIRSSADATAFLTGGMFSTQNSTCPAKDSKGAGNSNNSNGNKNAWTPTSMPDVENVNNSNNEASTSGVNDSDSVNSVPPLYLETRKGSKKNIVARRSYMSVFQEHIDFHRALTMSIIWSLVFLVWVPYVASGYRLAVEGGVGPVWAGWYPMTTMFANLTFVLKPVIYLAHNKHIREDVKSSFSSKALDTARFMTTKLGEKLQKIDAVLFKTPKANAQAVRAVANAKVSLRRWKQKISSNRKNSSEEKKLEPKLAVVNEEDYYISTIGDLQADEPTTTRSTTGRQTPEGRHTPTSPTGAEDSPGNNSAKEDSSPEGETAM